MGERVLITDAKSRWSLEETRALEDLWSKAPMAEIESAIPNRTWRSMGTKASRMNIKREILGRNLNGTFKRTRKRFSLDNFNDGLVDHHGRFRVWLPEHPRAYREGYIMRSIVAYEAYHGVAVPSDMDVHHIDGNWLNDSKENLALLPHGKHSKLSNSKKKLNAQITRVCEHCGKEFTIERGRLKDPTRGQYCSQRCFQAQPKSKETKNKIRNKLIGGKRTPDTRRKMREAWIRRRNKKGITNE